jgi:hypothetical protein
MPEITEGAVGLAARAGPRLALPLPCAECVATIAAWDPGGSVKILLLIIAASLVLAGCKTTSLPVPHVRNIEQSRTTLCATISANSRKPMRMANVGGSLNVSLFT